MGNTLGNGMYSRRATIRGSACRPASPTKRARRLVIVLNIIIGLAVKPPPGIEPRLTLAACALRLRAPPFTRRGGPPPPPCRRACGPRACVRPAGVASPRCQLTPARARGVLAWRRREI
jgi:hypothetical protein